MCCGYGICGTIRPCTESESGAYRTSTYLDCHGCHQNSCLFCEMKHVMNDSNYEQVWPSRRVAPLLSHKHNCLQPLLLGRKKEFVWYPELLGAEQKQRVLLLRAGVMLQQRNSKGLQWCWSWAWFASITRACKRQMSKHETTIDRKC